jgi:hypothetical protein
MQAIVTGFSISEALAIDPVDEKVFEIWTVRRHTVGLDRKRPGRLLNYTESWSEHEVLAEAVQAARMIEDATPVGSIVVSSQYPKGIRPSPIFGLDIPVKDDVTNHGNVVGQFSFYVANDGGKGPAMVGVAVVEWPFQKGVAQIFVRLGSHRMVADESVAESVKTVYGKAQEAAPYGSPVTARPTRTGWVMAKGEQPAKGVINMAEAALALQAKFAGQVG